MRNILGLILAILSLQGCTVAYYDIANPIDIPVELGNLANVSYSVDLELIFRERERTPGGIFSPEGLEKRKLQYIQTTKNVLDESGIDSDYAQDGSNSDLNISILINPYFHSLPQEYLTGLSFGLIPSTSLREQEFLFTFSIPETNSSHSYIIDEFSASHILLTPATPVSFIGLDEQRIYARALRDFIGTPSKEEE